MLKKKSWIFISLSLLIFFLGINNCGKKSVAPTSHSEPRNLVKNSSFEQNGDSTTEGWEGASSSNVYRDAPTFVGGGVFCLGLSGGCVWAYALYLLDSVEDGGIYELSCWAKKEQYGVGGAGISFFNKRTRNFGKSSPVLSRNWTRIALVDTLSIAPGDSIYVALEVGGGIFSSCTGFFDLVQVIKIN